MKSPTKRQVLRVLREEIEIVLRSQKEWTGRSWVMRDPKGLHEIECFKQAIKAVEASKLK